MGSKKRIFNRVRTNDDFHAISRYLDQLGLRHRVIPAPGKGHPYLRVTMPDGREADHMICCTPRGGGNAQRALAKMRRWLTAQGIDNSSLN